MHMHCCALSFAVTRHTKFAFELSLVRIWVQTRASLEKRYKILTPMIENISHSLGLFYQQRP